MTTVHIVPPRDPNAAMIATAVGAITELVDWKKVDSSKGADWTICLEVPQVVQALKDGAKVLHVGPGPSDFPLETLARQNPGRYEYASSVGFDGHPSVVTKIMSLGSFGSATKAIAADVASAEGLEHPTAKFTTNSPCPVSGLTIAVIDDKQVNLESAHAQLSTKNQVTVYRRYEDLLQALTKGETPRPDLLLSDMLMPVEDFCLGTQARNAHLGADIPAGMFIVFAAARAKIPQVIIQTDAGHHDHPALAMVDFLGWGREFVIDQTKVTIVHARVNNGVKDWGAGIDVLKTPKSI